MGKKSFLDAARQRSANAQPSPDAGAMTRRPEGLAEQRYVMEGRGETGNASPRRAAKRIFCLLWHP